MPKYFINSAGCITMMDLSSRTETLPSNILLRVLKWRLRMHRVGTFLPSWAYMANEKYNKAYKAYQQALYHDGCNFTFWFSISVLYFQITVFCVLLFPCHLFNHKYAPLSHPGNLTKSNSDDLRSSPVSTPELRSNKSLYQESDIPLNH